MVTEEEHVFGASGEGTHVDIGILDLCHEELADKVTISFVEFAVDNEGLLSLHFKVEGLRFLAQIILWLQDF